MSNHYMINNLTTGIRAQLLFSQYKNWIKKNSKTLDVGCGDGILSSLIVKRFKAKLTGCDIENYLKSPIPFVSMKNKSKIPFPDKSFDIVMLNDVLHHIDFSTQEKLIKEALRVGKRVVIFEVEPTLIGSLSDYIINKFHNFKMNIPLTFRTHEEWIKLFSKLSVNYEYKKIKKPFFYPFQHQALYIYAKKNK